MDNDCFRILSIDGGGIRGIFSAEILSVFEQYFQTKISDHFHLLCGTSTGGIISLALAAGYSAQEIKNFYYEKGPNIFKKIFLSTIKQILGNGKYSNIRLKQELINLFGDKKISDSKCYLCIPSFDLKEKNVLNFVCKVHLQ